MTRLALLPPIPRTPHDPLRLTLDRTRGWRAAVLDGVAVDEEGGALVLDLAPGAPTLGDPSGSLAGLVAPALVAVGPGCDVWLLDAATCVLRKFDDCACAFVAVPFIGGPGSGARQFESPGGIAVARGNLFVADTGNARVDVFALRGFALRGTLSVPVGKVAHPWQPVAVRADDRGRVFVADPANGCVHRFGAHGAWELAIAGLGDVRHLGVDCHGWLYVVTSASTVARVFDGDAQERDPVASPRALRGRFAPLPFRVRADGSLDFAGFGAACASAFDLHGDVLPPGAPDAPLRLATDGTFRSQPLDSAIGQCQWHRVILRGAIPAGTSVTVSTRTSEVAEPDDVVAALPDTAWETARTARRAPGSDGCDVDWDCLVLSGPGRFLWLRLALHGDARATPALCSVALEMPRLSLARWLPAVYSQDPAASDFTHRFLALFDTTLRSIERQVDTQARLLDARSAPAVSPVKGAPDFLSWLGSWIGIALDRHWPEERRRRFLREAPALFDRRGTTAGLRAVLLLYLGLGDAAPRSHAHGPAPVAADRCRFPNRCGPADDPCAPPPPPRPPCLPPLLLEHWRLRRWLFVGGARLGEESMVWGKAIVDRSRLDDGAQADVTRLITEQDPFRDPFHVYASTFTVFLPACTVRDDAARRGVESLLREESPAHTRWHLELVEARFRIGRQSMIGYDSVVGRYPPERVTLDQSTLGRSTILGGPTDVERGPSLRVGNASRIGSTTQLG